MLSSKLLVKGVIILDGYYVPLEDLVDSFSTERLKWRVRPLYCDIHDTSCNCC